MGKKDVCYKYHVHEVDTFNPAADAGSLFHYAASGDVAMCQTAIDAGKDVNESCHLGQDYIECVPMAGQGATAPSRFYPTFNRIFCEMPEIREMTGGFECTCAGNTDLKGFYKPRGIYGDGNLYFNDKGAKMQCDSRTINGTRQSGFLWYDSSGAIVAWATSTNKVRGSLMPALTGWEDYEGNLVEPPPLLVEAMIPYETGSLVWNPIVNDCLKGWRPLHFAAGNGHAEVVALLLKAGAEPNAATDGFQWTALHIAAPRAENGHLDCVRVLLENGADANQKCRADATPADYLEMWSWRFTSQFDMLSKWCLVRGNENPKFVEHKDFGRRHDASKMKYIYEDLKFMIESEFYAPILDLLFKYGCDPNNVSGFAYDGWVKGSTALHRQAKRNTELPDFQSQFHRLGFDSRKSFEIIECYLKYGADTTLTDANGLTPLDCAEDKIQPLKDLLSQDVKGAGDDTQLTAEELEAGDLTIYVKMSTDKPVMGYCMGDVLTMKAFRTDTVATIKQKIKHVMPEPMLGEVVIKVANLPFNAKKFILEGTSRNLDPTATLEDLQMLQFSVFTVMLPHDDWKNYYLSKSPIFNPGTHLRMMQGKRGQMFTVKSYKADTQEYVMESSSKSLVEDFFVGGIGYIWLGPWGIGSIDDDHFGIFHQSKTDKILAFHKTDGFVPFSEKDKIRNLRLHFHGGRKGHNKRHPVPYQVAFGDGFMQFEFSWRLGVVNECLSLSHCDAGAVYVWKSDGSVLQWGDDELVNFNVWDKDYWDKETYSDVAVGRLNKCPFFGVKGCPRFVQLGKHWRFGDADSEELMRCDITLQEHFVVSHMGTKKVNWVADCRLEVAIPSDSDAYDFLTLAKFPLATRPDSTLVLHASDIVYEGNGNYLEYCEMSSLGEYVVAGLTRSYIQTELYLAMQMPGFDINTQIQFGDANKPNIYGYPIWLLDYEKPLYNKQGQDHTFGCGRIEFGYGDTLLHIFVRNALNRLTTTRQICILNSFQEVDVTLKNAGGLTAGQLTAFNSKDPSKTRYAVPPSWFDIFGGLPGDCGFAEPPGCDIAEGPRWLEPVGYDDSATSPEEDAAAMEADKYSLFGLLEIVNPPEDSRSYSSSRELDQSMLDSATGWCPETWDAFSDSDNKGWMQIDLGDMHSVGGVVVQGAGSECKVFDPLKRIQAKDQWVSQVSVQYSEDGSAWVLVPGVWKGCIGDKKGKRVFKDRVLARYIRIVPNKFEVYPILRAGVLVCHEATNHHKMEQVSASFASLDKNDDGLIDELELQEAFVNLGIPANRASALLAAAPGMEDGKFSYDEFLSWVFDQSETEPTKVVKPEIDFIQHSGYISAGGDIRVSTMTLDEAKSLALTLPGCLGFCHGGPPTDDLATYYFKSKWDLQGVGWTSYKIDH